MYHLTLHLTDNPSQQSGELTWTGALNGSFSSIKSQLTNTFSEPLTQSVTLGSHLYSVTIHPTTMFARTLRHGREGRPSPPTSWWRVGGVQGNGGPVHGGGPTVASVPEPSTFVLAVFAFSLPRSVTVGGATGRFLALASA